MNTTYQAISGWSSLLGSLLYNDPASPENAEIIAWAMNEEAAETWPFGQPRAGEALKSMSAALRCDTEGDNGFPAETHKAFNRLFVGPFRLPAPPWGSVYLDPESVIFGNETLELREWMRNCGMKLNLPDKEPEDHIGLMLLMLDFAVKQDVGDDDIRCLLEQHLYPWAPHYFDLLKTGAENQFYEALANLASATLEDWHRRFSLTPEVRPLSR